MTELEKARSNRYREIDYNKLIEELGASFNDHANHMEECCRTGTKPGRKSAVEPTINTLAALNCFLNSTRFDGRQLPLVVAGIGLLLDNLSDHMDARDKVIADTIQKCLAPGITSVNVSFMKPNQNGGT